MHFGAFLTDCSGQESEKGAAGDQSRRGPSVLLPGRCDQCLTLDGAHLLEPLHPGLSLRSPVVTGPSSDAREARQPAVTCQPPALHRQPHQPPVSQQPVTVNSGPRYQGLDTESSFYSAADPGPATSLVTEEAGGQRTISEFELKCGLGWKRFQAALFHCAACCIRCIGPV